MKHRPQAFLGDGLRVPWRKLAAGLVLLLAMGVSVWALNQIPPGSQEAGLLLVGGELLALGACRTKQFEPPGVVASSPKKSVVRRAQPCLGFRRENSSLTDRHATT